MPELPEAETIVRALKLNVTGAQVIEIIAYDRKFAREIIGRRIDRELPGKVIENVIRRGKGIVFQLSDSYNILIQLGMTGAFSRIDSHSNPVLHERFRIFFKDRLSLSFIDIRKFGKIKSFYSNKPHTIPSFLSTLGPEPFSKEFDVRYLWNTTREHKIKIKNFLLNQHLIAGIGNIYASEILFDAGIDPAREAASLKRIECEKLVQSIQKILTMAIEAGGTTISDYKQLDGSEGKFKNELLVYGRESEECLICRTPVQKIRISGRSTFFCPVCQA
jgi:formamidopyrimidine-DNA glycosylase